QSKSNDEAGPVSAEKRRRAAAAMRKNLAPLRKAADKAVAIVEQLQCAIDALDEQLAAPDLYQERPKLAERLMIDRGNTSKKLEAAELAWLEAQEAYEKAKAASEEAMQTAAN
ncbi:MAG: ABC transporter ATP-binding protein, partial [Pseudomonadota bacterium]